MVVSSIYAADVKNDGFYFNKLADGTLEVTYANEDPTKNAKKYVGDLVIPEEVKGMKVTAIGDFAFSGCVKLTSITIPASVTSIGERAFWFCAALPKVVIPASPNRTLIRHHFQCSNCDR